MTTSAFIRKWKASNLEERLAAQVLKTRTLTNLYNERPA
jgi:hypothetical protein